MRCVAVANLCTRQHSRIVDRSIVFRHVEYNQKVQLTRAHFFVYFCAWCHLYFPSSGQAVATCIAPSPPDTHLPSYHDKNNSNCRGIVNQFKVVPPIALNKITTIRSPVEIQKPALNNIVAQRDQYPRYSHCTSIFIKITRWYRDCLLTDEAVDVSHRLRHPGSADLRLVVSLDVLVYLHRQHRHDRREEPDGKHPRSPLRKKMVVENSGKPQSDTEQTPIT